MRSMWSRAACDASRSRGYHHTGVVTSRPSASVTCSRVSSQLAATGRAEYPYATDDEAVAAFELLSVTEGIVPALEPAHAVAWLAREAGRSVPAGATVLVTLSGRGDKDAVQVAERVTGEQLA